MATLLDALRAPARQAASLDETAHRPWPLPKGRWLLAHTLEDQLFAHWPVPESALRGLVPPGLEIDTFRGSAWLGISAFRVTGARVRGTLPVPVLSSYAQVNVRTYVTAHDRPGVFFLSLDSGSPLAPAAARRLYGLPFFRARTSVSRRGAELTWTSLRTERGAFPRAFRARARASGPAFGPEPETLEHFLTERYRLWVAHGRELRLADIHHAPWTLEPAEGTVDENTLPPQPLELPGSAPLLHLSRHQHLLVWPLERAAAPTRAAD